MSYAKAIAQILAAATVMILYMLAMGELTVAYMRWRGWL